MGPAQLGIIDSGQPVWDFYPTILEMTGAADVEGHTSDGISLAPVLEQSGTPAREALFLALPALRQCRLDTHWSRSPGRLEADRVFLRTATWSFTIWLKIRSRGMTWRATQPEKAAELQQLLEEWRTSVGAQARIAEPGLRPRAPRGTLRDSATNLSGTKRTRLYPATPAEIERLTVSYTPGGGSSLNPKPK